MGPEQQSRGLAGVAPQTNDSLSELTQGDPELEHKLKVLMLETEVMRQEGRLVPPSEVMGPEEWGRLLKLGSRSGRGKYLEYLFKTAKAKENRQVRTGPQSVIG